MFSESKAYVIDLGTVTVKAVYLCEDSVLSFCDKTNENQKLLIRDMLLSQRNGVTDKGDNLFVSLEISDRAAVWC